jgi:hypothetical protein
MVSRAVLCVSSGLLSAQKKKNRTTGSSRRIRSKVSWTRNNEVEAKHVGTSEKRLRELRRNETARQNEK